MKLSLKFLIVFAIFFLAFTNRASADWPDFGGSGSGHHDDGKGDKDWGWDDGDHHHHHHHDSGGSGGGIGSHAGVAPEPVSSVLFLFGAGVLALSYNQRRKLQTA